MEKVLITGVSSGVGRQLVKDLCSRGYSVFGIARRKDLLVSLKNELSKPNNFNFITTDLSDKDVWEKIIINLRGQKFIPDIVIFNAATWDKELVAEYSYKNLEKTHQVNFLSVMKGVSLLIPYSNSKKTHFIAISTLSALWGNSEEGVGYPASKAALSIAFEGLYQKFKKTNFNFTTVSLGPIKAETNSFKIFTPFQIDFKKAVKIINKSIKEKRAIYFAPPLLFFCFSLLRLLPTSLKLAVFSLINGLHPYHLYKK